MSFHFLKHHMYMNFKEAHMLIYIIFSLIFISLMAFSVSTPMILLPNMGPLMIYMNMFLCFIFSLEHMLHKDHERGTLDLYYLMHTHLEIYCALKLYIHWIIYGLSLILCIYTYEHILNIKFMVDGIYIYVYGTMYLNAIGFILCAFVLGLKQHVLLLYMMIYPMYIPYVICSSKPILLQIIAYLCVLLFICCPIITSYVLKKSFQ